MPTSSTSPIVAAGLTGGFAVARYTGRRELGGAVLAVAGAWCGRAWARSCSPVATAGLLGAYLAAFGASHPLAKRIGAWPSVLSVSALTSGLAYALADRKDG